jgi:hypothetical protein
VSTFENGWICKNCWTANREQDGHCYRCHQERPNYPSPEAPSQPTVTRAARSARKVVRVLPAATPAPLAATTAACPACDRPLTPKASFCTQCGTQVGAAERISPDRHPEADPAQAVRPVAISPQVSIPEPVVLTDRPPASPRRWSLPRPWQAWSPLAGRISFIGIFRNRVRAMGEWPRRLKASAPPFRRWITDARRVWVQSVRPTRQRSRLFWLSVAWVGGVCGASALLFAYAGASQSGGQLLTSLVLVLVLCVLSALTASVTSVILVRREVVTGMTAERRHLDADTPAVPAEPRSLRTAGDPGDEAQRAS